MKIVPLREQRRKVKLKPLEDIKATPPEPYYNQLLNGKDGVDGKDGRDGRDGSVGPRGPAGLNGKDGQGFNWRSNWLESEKYYPGDVVNYLGSSYVALTESVGDYPNRIKNGWDLVASAGAQGSSGRDGVDAPVVGVPTFIQDDQPTYEGSYVWIQTGLGDTGEDYAVYYNFC
jgi:hypothetical protein